MADDDGSSKVGEKIDEIKRKAALAAARKTLEKTGHELLDGVERWLFGKVGGAEEVLQEEAGRGGALDRLRDEAEGDEADEDAAVSRSEKRRADREARRAAAIAELEAIKARLHEGEDETADDAEVPDAPPEKDADPPPARRGRKTKRRL